MNKIINISFKSNKHEKRNDAVFSRKLCFWLTRLFCLTWRVWWWGQSLPKMQAFPKSQPLTKEKVTSVNWAWLNDEVNEFSPRQPTECSTLKRWVKRSLSPCQILDHSKSKIKTWGQRRRCRRCRRWLFYSDCCHPCLGGAPVAPVAHILVRGLHTNAYLVGFTSNQAVRQLCAAAVTFWFALTEQRGVLKVEPGHHGLFHFLWMHHRA